ncbi:hypothetical protein CEXT_379581 [Caerostris extrusa]|uniref:Uncharacterized protein n=1 Tax=Caerostris extrusa TaxID=172846 RepID=A0AAV4VGH4_CAEEX|nr:hypothetical protein CEXT_379581 [Caerostris extrusa]
MGEEKKILEEREEEKSTFRVLFNLSEHHSVLCEEVRHVHRSLNHTAWIVLCEEVCHVHRSLVSPLRLTTERKLTFFTIQLMMLIPRVICDMRLFFKVLHFLTILERFSFLLRKTAGR